MDSDNINLRTSRIIIIGGPRTGKTTMAEDLRRRAGVQHIRHTDDLADMEWSRASEVASTWIDEPAPWLIEGVAAVRALRKWLRRNPTGRPCELIILAWHHVVDSTPGQVAMARGVRTIWEGPVSDGGPSVKSDVESRGVRIAHLPAGWRPSLPE